MEYLTPEERFEVYKNALIHYKHGLETLSSDEKNETLQDLLKTHLASKFKLLDEIIARCGKKDVSSFKAQMDRYWHPLCLSLLLYNNDLKKCKETVEKFGDMPLNMKSIDNELNKLEMILPEFDEHIAFVKAGQKFPTF